MIGIMQSKSSSLTIHLISWHIQVTTIRSYIHASITNEMYKVLCKINDWFHESIKNAYCMRIKLKNCKDKKIWPKYGQTNMTIECEKNINYLRFGIDESSGIGI